jgi:hypothetical protein
VEERGIREDIGGTWSKYIMFMYKKCHDKNPLNMYKKEFL